MERRMIELMKDQLRIQTSAADLMSAAIQQTNIGNYIKSLHAEVSAINAILQNKTVTGEREMKLYDRLFELQSILRIINEASFDILGGENKEEAAEE